MEYSFADLDEGQNGHRQMSVSPPNERGPLGRFGVDYGVGITCVVHNRSASLFVMFRPIGFAVKVACIYVEPRKIGTATARVSKRPSHRSAACLRARHCTGVSMLRGLIFVNADESTTRFNSQECDFMKSV